MASCSTHFYWGSIFLVNLPIVVFGLIAGFVLIPTSKDPSAPKLDPVGAVLSIVALVVDRVRPHRGADRRLDLVRARSASSASAWWCSASSSGGSGAATTRCSTSGSSRTARFSAANAAITLIFFAMFGSIFLLTQYMQFTLGYTPLESGVRLLPYAITMMIVAPTSARVVERFGSKVTVATGLALAAVALFLMLGLQVDTSYPDLAWRLVILAAGMGLVMAPATDSVMGSLPLAKAGVGSAVNDTTRQVGGALGVAIVGSVVSSVYGTKIADFFAGKPAPKAAVDAAKNSLGGAYAVANDLSHRSIPGAKAIAASLLIRREHGVRRRVPLGRDRRRRRARSLGVRDRGGVPPGPGDRGPSRRRRRCPTTPSPRRAATDAVPVDGAAASRRGDRRRPRGRADVTAAPVRAGRPRSAEADDAILDAALDQFCEFGYDGLSVERVAAGAGRGQDHDLPPLPDEARPRDGGARAGQGRRARAPEGSGSLRDDLLDMARSYLAMLQSPTIGRAIPMMLASKARSDELAGAHAEFVRARRAPGHDLIRAGDRARRARRPTPIPR